MRFPSPTSRRVVGVATLAVCLAAGALSPASASTSARSTVATSQIQKIVRFTGYHRLTSHTYWIADRFSIGAARVEVARMDGARLAVPRGEVRRDVAQAVALAAHRDTFTTKLKVGPGPKQRITYRVSPMSAAVRQHLRYIIFAPHKVQLDNVTYPRRMPFVEAFTVISRNERLGMTLLHDNPDSAEWGTAGISSNKFCAMVESLNAVSNVNVSPATLRRLARHHVDLSYLTDPSHPNPTRKQELVNLAGRGFEIWSNSLGFAVVSARSGHSYHHYLHRLSRMGFAFYQKNQMHFLAMSAATYRQFAT